MGDFLKGKHSENTDYDESIVLRLIEKVAEHESKFTGEYNFGMAVNV